MQHSLRNAAGRDGLFLTLFSQFQREMVHLLNNRAFNFLYLDKRH